MAANPAPRWQRLEHDERRRQILVVARRLFSERSYAAVSTSDIAREAGVARGLLNHYFGTKRELYLEVVRTMVRTPPTPIPRAGSGERLEAAIGEAADRWLDMLERNRGMWLATIGGQGLGHDPEVEAILDEAREQACARLIAALDHPGLPNSAEPPDALKAVVRAYGGMAEVASVEWLRRGRLTRDQVRAILVSGFLAAVGEIYDAVASVAPSPRSG
jgi:AcrR family transcriptional regulator